MYLKVMCVMEYKIRKKEGKGQGGSKKCNFQDPDQGRPHYEYDI